MAAGMSDAKFLQYMEKDNLGEFLRHTQYSVGVLEAQPIENVTKVLTTYFASLKKIIISRNDPALGKERALTYKLMHNVLARKMKRQLIDNPPEKSKKRNISRSGPEILDMAIIMELERILPNLIIDCVVNRVPLDGLRDLQTKVTQIRAAYDTAEFRVVKTQLRF